MPESEVDYGRKWFVMAAVAMGIFLATIDGSIVNVALPTLVRELHTNFATIQWVVLAYMLTVATLMLSIGRLADLRGKKPIYTAGFVTFTAGSVLCGLAPGVYWLIAFRVLQGIGAAMVFALGMAIVTEAFPPQERGKALGFTGAVVSLGIVVGPTLGGLLIDALSWHWIFFVNLPVGILGTYLSIRFVPSILPPGGERFDFAGALTLFASLLALLLGLTIGQSLGFGDMRVLALLAVSFVGMLVFIRIEQRSKNPMVDLAIFRNRLFTVSLATGLITFIAIAGTTLLMPFYLENVLGLRIREVGLLLAVVPVALGVTAPVAGALSDRLGTRPITLVGLVLLLVGYLLVSTLGEDTSSAGYIMRFLPIGLGMGVFQSPNNSAIMGAARRDQLGIVSGMLALNRTLGQIVGIAVLGAVWASRTAAKMDGPLPQGAPSAPPAIQVAALHDTFMLVVALIAIALGLSLWGLARARKEREETYGKTGHSFSR